MNCAYLLIYRNNPLPKVFQDRDAAVAHVKRQYADVEANLLGRVWSPVAGDVARIVTAPIQDYWG